MCDQRFHCGPRQSDQIAEARKRNRGRYKKRIDLKILSFASTKSGIPIDEVEGRLGSLIYEFEDLYYEERNSRIQEGENLKWFAGLLFKLVLISDYSFTHLLNGFGPYSPMKTDLVGKKFDALSPVLYPAQRPQSREVMESFIRELNQHNNRDING